MCHLSSYLCQALNITMSITMTAMLVTTVSTTGEQVLTLVARLGATRFCCSSQHNQPTCHPSIWCCHRPCCHHRCCQLSSYNAVILVAAVIILVTVIIPPVTHLSEAVIIHCSCHILYATYITQSISKGYRCEPNAMIVASVCKMCGLWSF